MSSKYRFTASPQGGAQTAHAGDALLGQVWHCRKGQTTNCGEGGQPCDRWHATTQWHDDHPRPQHLIITVFNMPDRESAARAIDVASTAWQQMNDLHAYRAAPAGSTPTPPELGII